MKYILVSVVSVVLLTPALGPAGAQGLQVQEFTATGRAKIAGNDINTAQQLALQNALWLVLQQAVDTLIVPGARSEHSEAIRVVIARSRNVIVKYTITQRGPKGGYFIIVVKAQVDMGALVGRLRAANIPLLPEAAKFAPQMGTQAAQAYPAQTATPVAPVIMVVIPETHLTRPRVPNLATPGVPAPPQRTQVPDPAAETQVIKRLVAAGFTVVDQTKVAAIRYTPELQQLVQSPSASVAKTLASRFQADVLVVGEAFSETAGMVGSMVSVRARVEARVIVASTGQIVASEAATASAVDIAENIAGKAALANAADLIVDQILPRLAALGAPPTAAQPAPAQAPQAAPAQPSQTPPTTPPPPSGQPERLRIAVLPFQVASVDPQWTQRWDIGVGVTEMVEEALFNSGRYRLVERRQLEQVLREQGIGLTGAVDAGTVARIGRVLGVQAFVTGTVNQFELASAGGFALPIIAVGLYRAQVGLTARIIDTSTAEILAVVRGNGKAEGAVAVAYLQGLAFGSGEFKNSVLGKALDQAIQELVSKLDAALTRR